MNNLSINNFPKISVIMPSFNSALYISEAIESFLDQSYQVKELIIVDGKSTDNTHEIIQLYLNKHDNIHWLKEPDTCVTDAINKGIKFSSAEFIGFLMTDDRYCYLDFFKEAFSLNNYIDYDVLYSNTYYYYTVNKNRLMHYYTPINQLNRCDMLLKGSSVAIIDSTIIKRSIFEKHKLDVNYNLSSDYEFFLKIGSEDFLFFYLNKFSTCCYYNGDNLSSKNFEKQMAEFSKVSIKFLIENITDFDANLFHNAISRKTFKFSELKSLENLLILLLKKNELIEFYPNDFFKLYIKNLWKETCNKKNNFLKKNYITFSSPIFDFYIVKNGGLKNLVKYYIYRMFRRQYKIK